MRCKFCTQDISSKNFVRHIETFHRNENEIKEILQYPVRSKERREAFILLRKNTNFDLYIGGIIRPYRETAKKDNILFYPCVYCKGLFKKEYLGRHTKSCVCKKTVEAVTLKKCRLNYISESQTLIACASDITNVISKLNVKQQV